jgi:beta-lactamase regulating signal transducer with metallopeptidase domain
MTWILWILSVSSVLLAIDFSFCKKKKKKKKEKEKEKKKKKKRGKKELKQKAPCNNSNLVIPFKHDQVLLNFQC